MRVLGLVTARGGSKGFPNKNLARLAGRALVGWAHRLFARLRDRHPELHLHLSTDSAAIAEAWPACDRPARLRPAELAGDESSSLDVVEYELNAAAAEGRSCGAVLLLQPTSPLLALDDLEAAWQRFEQGCPSVIGLAETAHPLTWAWRMDARGRLSHALPDASDRRRQDVPSAYIPAGFYLADARFLRERRAFAAAGTTQGVVVPSERAVDIDRALDLELAGLCLEHASRRDGFELAGRRVGSPGRCFVIAEAGVNHDGDVEKAMALIAAAAEAGADAIKFQTFKAEKLVATGTRKAKYQAEATGGAEDQLAMLARLEFPARVFQKLKAEAERRGLVFLSTPFDPESLRVLADLGVAALKLGSGELTNTPFLEEIAGAGMPVLLSTGMATLEEVELAVEVLRKHGTAKMALLHCVSSYPAPADQCNLRAMDALRTALGGPVGLSDHTLGWEVALAGVARGAELLEKHLTLDRAMPGPDHAASLEPHEFAVMIRQLRNVEAALGDGIKRPAPCELDTREVARKSLVAVRDLPKGALLCRDFFICKRPGTGVPPHDLGRILGRTLRMPLKADEPLTWRHVG